MRAPPIRTVLWLIAASFALHEAEEWNLVLWLAAHFEPQPAFSDRDARTLLVLFSLLSVGFTSASLRFLSPQGALFALLPLFGGVVLGNALTHIVWSLYFQTYAPGVATSAVLLVPLILYLVVRVVRERLVPGPFLVPWLALALAQPVGALLAGSTLSGPQLALQRFGARLGQCLWGAA